MSIHHTHTHTHVTQTQHTVTAVSHHQGVMATVSQLIVVRNDMSSMRTDSVDQRQVTQTRPGLSSTKLREHKTGIKTRSMLSDVSCEIGFWSFPTQTFVIFTSN